MTTELRVATFNASLNRSTEGGLISDLSTPSNAQAKAVAEIIQRSAPDIVLINEFDFDAAGPGGTSLAAQLFQQNYLGVSQNGVAAIDYPYFYIAPSNTGVASGLDLNNNGVAVTTPGAAGYGDDALGFGAFPGQFGMVIFSKYPIDVDSVRTFQNFLWKDMPDARLPDDSSTSTPQDWYSPEELAVLPLSSKSHWDVPVNVNGEIVHILAAHPTPPVFDGLEDRNGLRNADEIRFWADYVRPGQGDYIYDDQGGTGGLAPSERFVIVGDYNADPNDGDSVDAAIQQILTSPTVDNSVIPTSAGAVEQNALQGGANTTHTGNPSFDTADFADTTPGNLRVDYVLPSQTGLDPISGGVFWPLSTDPTFPLVGTFDPALPGGFPSSDHKLVFMDIQITDEDRRDVTGIEFLGEVTFPTGLQLDGTEIGGLSGLTFDPLSGVYYAISDDRSQIDPARFYTLTIDLGDGSLGAGDVAFTDVTMLTDADGNPFPALSLDPEGIALTANGLYISSEGEANPAAGRLTAPFVNLFSLAGQQIGTLPVDAKFLPTADQSTGIRNNLALESLTVTPDQTTLYTATENALFPDGPAAGVDNGSASRIVQYDLATGQAIAEFVYTTEAVDAAPVPAGSFATNGLVDLLAVDNDGTLLAIERSFSTGVGNAIKIFEVRTQGATDVSDIDAIPTAVDDGELEANVDQVVQKELLFDLADLGIPLDNIEGISFGPKLADGRQSIILVSDNNFSGTQFTQFLAFAIVLEDIPTIEALVETPAETRFPDTSVDEEGPDPDDPAIWLNPFDPNDSMVVTSHKNGGLRVYDLAGNELQSIEPEGIRYNNVDVLYNVKVDGLYRDLFVASDRANDTLAIYAVDPATRTLADVTAVTVPASIFGVDDGEATAYGLDAFTAADGTSYVFVTQAGGDKIAQLKLVDVGDGKLSAEVVRLLTLPNPDGVDPEELQSEGIVIDDATGIGYVSVESGGIYSFSTDSASDGSFTEFVAPGADFLTPDLEGLSIRYADDGSRQLFVSSQGDSTFSVLDLATGGFLGRFAVASNEAIDGAEESDGLDIFSEPLGSAFPNGLIVVHDGSNDPQNVFPDPDDGEIQNFDANFKFVDLAQALHAVGVDAAPFSGDPRDGLTTSLSENGVASGEVTQDSIVLWARSLAAGEVNFEIATDAAFSHIVATASADSFGDVPVKVAVDGLDAGTHYYYRATGPAGDAIVGEFSTAHENGYHGLSFGVSGDWRGGLTPYAALSNADERDLDFFVQLGDTIYGDVPSPAFPAPQAETVDDYHTKYEETLSERGGENFLADLRASTLVFSVIDDHEVTNDFAGGAPTTSDPRFDPAGADFINETGLYNNGLEAFHDYQPIEERVWSGTGDDRVDGAPDLYRTENFGSDAAVFVLDARSFRDEELENADPTNPADVGRFLAESFDPDRTMLGDPQLERLKADLLEAQENGTLWKFVMVPEPIQNLGVVGAADRFEGYAAERTELLRFIDDHDIDNVVFVAADIHGTLVNNLTYQTSPGGPQIALDALEISTGAVAYSPELGPTVVGLAVAAGLISPQEAAFYGQLPVANDGDSIVNDKDDFLKALINGQLDQFGYDRLGLNDNLVVADGLVDASLLQGDYVAAHSFGWTELDIDPVTQVLTVTTYGVPSYTEAEALADPAAIAARKPVIVSKFEVYPDLIKVGGPGDDIIQGGKGDDELSGLGGNDTLVGREGDDELDGGEGNDNLRGDAGNDTLDGGAGNDMINGGAGADTMNGGAGNDSYTVDVAGDEVVEAADEGTDRVTASISYVLGANVENLVLTGAAAIDGTGNELNNTITGNAAANVLSGLGGNDALMGLGGDDTLNGGDGNDSLQGGDGADILAGGDGNDTLNGGAGADSMAGGAGNDSYTVDDAGDEVVEAADEGTDRASASISYLLGANVENLTLTGTAAIDGFGNELNNAITGNAAANVLNGAAGNDTLSGLAGVDTLIGGDGNDSLSGGDDDDTLLGGIGNDALNGGAGADIMIGAAGNDTYTVDAAGDTVIEAANAGTDRVNASIGYTLGANVENLGLTGTAAIDGTGNELNNAITGNSAANMLSGLDGNDNLQGGDGNDALVGGDGNDTLGGGNGDDLLLGGAGIDAMTGGGGSDTFLLRHGFGLDRITDFGATDLLDLRDFGFASAQAAIDAFTQSGANAVLELGGGDRITLQNVQKSNLQTTRLIVSDEITGPSSSQSPYLLSSASNVVVESLLTAGDSIGGYTMAGIPDGLGAYDNGDDTFTVLMNHEIPGGLGAVRAHGAQGAFVSQWVIDKTTLQVQSGQDLIQNVFVAADGFAVDHSAANGNGIAFSRFCSADLAEPGAFFNAASGLGYNGGRLYLNGEESGVEGRPFAHIASGADAGTSYEIASLGNMAFENLVANAHTGDRTIVGALDDGQNGQVYFYAGDKKATGSAVDKAGLTGGHLFGIKVEDFAGNSDNAANSTTPLGADDTSNFSMVDLGDVSGMTGAEIDAASEAAGVASFLRPEDGAWDTINPNRFYFVSTNGFNSPSQLWAVDFTDAAHPELGGTLRLLLNGSEGQQMLDNIAVDGSGKVILQEDVGNNAHLGKVWQYDPATDSLAQIAEHDASRFVTGGANFLTQDEEASGVIDITSILGNAGENVYLVDTQAHFSAGVPADQFEGGQLQIIHQYLV